MIATKLNALEILQRLVKLLLLLSEFISHHITPGKLCVITPLDDSPTNLNFSLNEPLRLPVHVHVWQW